MSKRLPWFRMYADFLNDPKLISLAFEDQRHFIGVLALKCDGAIDDVADCDLLDRIVAQRLWIDHAVIRDVKRRLIAAGLIDARWQPLAWDKRQMRSDVDATGAERQRRYRGAQKHNALRDAAVTRLEEDTDTDIDKEEDKKNTKTRANAPPDGVSPSLWADFKKIRAAKKAAITETAMNGIAREAQAAGISLADALTMCCERNWIAFKADWYDNATAKPTAMKAANSETTYQRSMRERVAEFSPSIAKQAPGAPYPLSNMTLEAENVTTITRS